jgi:hypothetical protein
MDYNCWLPTNPAQFATLDLAASYITWATYHATYEAHSINADPQFTNAAGGTFTIASHTSPVIDAGTDVDMTTDYAGNAVPGTDRDEATPDMGAYQMTAAQIATARDAANAATITAAALDTDGTNTDVALGASTATIQSAALHAAAKAQQKTTDQAALVTNAAHIRSIASGGPEEILSGEANPGTLDVAAEQGEGIIGG